MLKKGEIERVRDREREREGGHMRVVLGVKPQHHSPGERKKDRDGESRREGEGEGEGEGESKQAGQIRLSSYRLGRRGPDTDTHYGRAPAIHKYARVCTAPTSRKTSLLPVVYS